MSIIVPFNFDPELTTAIDAVGSYTVPAGRFAIADVTISAFVGFGGISAGALTDLKLTEPSESTSFTVRLEEGDILDFSVVISNTGPVVIGGNAFGTLTHTVNQRARLDSGSGAAIIGEIFVSGSLTATAGAGGATATMTQGGFANAVISQYQKQS